MSYRIYLDDERDPKTDHDWVIARNFKELVAVMLDPNRKDVWPSYISFDHDLGDDETGLDCLKWYCELIISMHEKYAKYPEVLPTPCVINFHTANPVGRDNMVGYLKSVIKYLKTEYDVEPLQLAPDR